MPDVDMCAVSISGQNQFNSVELVFVKLWVVSHTRCCNMSVFFFFFFLSPITDCVSERSPFERTDSLVSSLHTFSEFISVFNSKNSHRPQALTTQTCNTFSNALGGSCIGITDGSDIWNVDETSVTTVQSPSYVVSHHVVEHMAVLVSIACPVQAL
ncbi:hypothetical protein CHARACLAT_001560 [Characodon lateralis]|uniref:Uncharacterized protein n=1 Tax=Characodon lateralis TaxID=208331 RepID=A0ABU7CUD5_9TELE|nr:hypothetical protein [Characodon lateralis]